MPHIYLTFKNYLLNKSLSHSKMQVTSPPKGKLPQQTAAHNGKNLQMHYS